MPAACRWSSSRGYQWRCCGCRCQRRTCSRKENNAEGEAVSFLLRGNSDTAPVEAFRGHKTPSETSPIGTGNARSAVARSLAHTHTHTHTHTNTHRATHPSNGCRSRSQRHGRDRTGESRGLFRRDPGGTIHKRERERRRRQQQQQRIVVGRRSRTDQDGTLRRRLSQDLREFPTVLHRRIPSARTTHRVQEFDLPPGHQGICLAGR
mmetsp:Transcript_29608/g.61738  ORF Transcript_29608/g.61738 Transcript_29608/m.61738 type:complete len:207 (-) Transcript_29608:459-1079(-)